MTFRLWHSKSQPSSPPALISINPTPELHRMLLAAAADARIPFSTELPQTGDFILALDPKDPTPEGVAPHIPIVDSTSKDIGRLIEAALLYLKAHQSIKR